MNKIARGEVWNADLDPVRGHEQAGKRPVLILSVDRFNNSPAELIIVLPITTKVKAIPSHIEVLAGEANLKYNCFIKCEDIRSISKERLSSYVGIVSGNTMKKVEDTVRILLGL
ncbi:MAG: type II toxin-antitoxin system PemK/MazF family toxin [Blastocatellia bacterium]|nr:type II toxin-antitoxin system PemK/MazF family toxin [Blastocatellia bacterium]